eukprot:gnl/TRDRNA2_/TRDRNA2_119211_c1_seq1.p1 gnl/TRDRNA2_/TRDRNA2_119211_c1~~gnl/TRDRNA2_/TRDRNA2_119211_c1_seq1.p1  ORF type:complete len:538 (-),score=94.58 gnl/TRDRNA2_/TRDRNA2_119211_c1_seq1:38-1417(-)
MGAQRPSVSDEEMAAHAEMVANRRSATTTCLEHLAVQMETAHERDSKSLTESVAEARRLAKAVGEKISTLRPSWRVNAKGVRASGAGASNSNVPSKRIDGLIRSLSTVQGRKQLQAEEEGNQKTASAKASAILPAKPMTAPPVESVAADEWRIKGVYDHQVLKAGLRHIDAAWPTNDLYDFPRSKDGGSVLLRERLLRDLLHGDIQLQSVPNSDVAAAQRDVQRLSLRQLLRLRVLHLDFTPSGCGADTVSAVGGTHQAFLSTLDGLLFQHLGRKAANHLVAAATAEKGGDTEAHRLGREAVLLAAASAAIPSPSWWVWWVSEEHRIFFDTAAFVSVGTFPSHSSGVLETQDQSWTDRHEPTGKLRWMDWKVFLITKELDLSPAPRREPSIIIGAPSTDAAGQTNSENHQSTVGSVGNSAGGGASAPGPGPVATIGASLSAEGLAGMRRGLRKVGTLPP